MARTIGLTIEKMDKESQVVIKGDKPVAEQQVVQEAEEKAQEKPKKSGKKS